MNVAQRNVVVTFFWIIGILAFLDIAVQLGSLIFTSAEVTEGEDWSFIIYPAVIGGVCLFLAFFVRAGGKK